MSQPGRVSQVDAWIEARVSVDFDLSWKSCALACEKYQPLVSTLEVSRVASKATHGAEEKLDHAVAF